ncbi:PhoD-like phosphatase-domain-containing protein [Flammula alnicola]|nr:PhoD-like phosphatase-domain-containing protein [Flammula alnicola]
MHLLPYIPSIFSSLFRIFSYVFLQIIPARLGKHLLPSFYFLYLFTTWLCPLPPTHAVHEKHNGKKHNGAAHLEKHVKTPQNYLATLCFSLPTESLFLTWTNLLINTLLLLAAADLALTPFFDTASDVVFTRVGAVYPDSVKIVVRYPQPNVTEESLLILYRETSTLKSNDSIIWKDGPHIHLKEQSDWVDTARLVNLWPSTSYEYSRLQTAGRFQFIATSCTTPNFPYRGPLHKRTIAGFDLLANYLQTSSTPSTPLLDPDVHNNNLTSSDSNNATNTVEDNDVHLNDLQRPSTDFMLFLGDFIYADIPLYIGDDREAYRRLYRRNYQSPSFRKVYEQLPIFHAYDDHEFVNNYVGKSEDVPPFVNASDAYNIYAGNANYDSSQPGQNFYDFQHGDVAFFVMDTRRYRSDINGPGETYRTMLGDAQLTSLYNGFTRYLSLAPSLCVNETCSFKFIVSSAALLTAFHSVPNVIIISGDRHEFAALEFNTPDPRLTLPLSMFYVPLIHTLRSQSQESFVRNLTNPEDGTEEVPYEKAIAYIPKGNSKWSTFQIDTRNARKPTLRIETVIDGMPAYHLEIIGVPAKAHHTGFGSLVTTNVMDLFDKIGLKPGKWF